MARSASKLNPRDKTCRRSRTRTAARAAARIDPVAFPLAPGRRFCHFPTMLVLAAATTLERIQKIPKEIWLTLLVGVVVVVAAVFIFRKLQGANKIWLTIIAAAVVMIVGFQWVYERNEPKFLTPFVDKVAPFFPSKIDYNQNQQKGPKM
jgi:predicted neutral ceramidase superfamily lipid hydrolase